MTYLFENLKLIEMDTFLLSVQPPEKEIKEGSVSLLVDQFYSVKRK
jgi:hypothetical protein